MFSKKLVVLINPPLYFDNGRPGSLDVSVAPLGLLYLASYINKYSENFQVEIIDIGAEEITLKETRDLLIKKNPFVIGISAMTPQLQGVLELAKTIKKYNQKGNTKIFLGGPHISADPDFIERHADFFDYAITGEAEKTFLDSLEKLLRGEDLPKIQTGEILMDLDTVPFPDVSLLKSKKYIKAFSTLFSRGCPFQCYYCSRPSISRIVRYRSVKNMMEEIRFNYKKCEGKIHFQDDTFTLKRDVVIDFCRQVREAGLKLDWECNTRIDLSDEELLKAMKEAGCSQINFGIESASERVRKEIIHKGNFTNKQIKEIFGFCKKYGIKIACYFMIGHPTETKEEIQETKDMILNSKLDVLGLSIPTPFPGSALYTIAESEGMINEEIIDQFAEKKLGEGYSGIYPVHTPTHLPAEYIYAQMREINRKFYVNFRTFWKNFKQDIISFKKIRSDAADLFSLIFRGVSSRKPYIKKTK